MGWWQAVVDAAGDFSRHILSIADDLVPTPPAEVVQACGQVNSFLAEQSWVSEIFPIWALATGGAMVLAAIIASAAIRASRIAVSVKTGGGGA